MLYLGIVLLIISFYMSAYTIFGVSCVADKREPLQDVVHYFADKYLTLPKYFPLPEILIVVYSVLCIIYCTQMVPNILFVVSFILIIRSVFYCVTILPQCDVAKRQFTFSEWNFKSIVSHYYNKPYDLGGTNDLIFSAHASVIVLLSLYLTNYAFVSLFSRVIIWLTTGLMSLMIVVFKKHYTIDIITAVVTTLYIFDVCNRL